MFTAIPAGSVRRLSLGRNAKANPTFDLGRAVPRDGSLEPWARHGVLLLNAVLTVRRGRPRSHAHQGWEDLTGAILAAVADKPEPIVFLLWGADAQELAKRCHVDGSRHIVLASTHPSLRSAKRATRSVPTARRRRPVPCPSPTTSPHVC